MDSPSPQEKTNEESSPVYLKLRKKAKDGVDKPNPLEQVIAKKMGGDNIWYYEVKWRNSAVPCWEPIDRMQPYKEMIEKFEKFNSRKENRERLLQESEDKPVKKIKRNPTSKDIPTRIEYSEGRFELGDKARDIILLKLVKNDQNKEKDIMCLVEWMPRSNGATPLCTLVNSKELRKQDPALLIEFYEKKVSFYSVPLSLARTEELYQYYHSKRKV